MQVKVTKAYGNYQAGQTYTTSSAADEAAARQAIADGNAQEVGAVANGGADGGAVGQTQAGGTIAPDGKTVVLPDGSRGSVGAQQLQPQKGPQVREGVTGRPV